jgi:hypothetical protein
MLNRLKTVVAVLALFAIPGVGFAEWVRVCNGVTCEWVYRPPVRRVARVNVVVPTTTVVESPVFATQEMVTVRQSPARVAVTRGPFRVRRGWFAPAYSSFAPAVTIHTHR